MGDIIADAAGWLAQQRKAVMSQTVQWRRGGDTASVSATVGRTVFEIENTSGRVESITSRTFTINTSDLTTTPQERDEIVETFNGVEIRNAVFSPGGTPAVVFADSAKTAWKVYTKVIG